ncbi:MAG: ABC transporter substrate-binding protein [Deltaproteobacteria bacterium]|nr:ABC transporter substrate-binding protein [Deltaproteobacteria bacterium]
MRLRHLVAACALALSPLLVAGNAAADLQGAESFVQKEHGQLKKLLEAQAPHEQVRTAIDGMVDYDELARRTLGKPCPLTIPSCTNHWDELNADQQKEVTGLLRQLVEKNLRKNINKTKNYDVTYRGSREQGTSISKIRTEAKSKDKPRDPAVQVDYMILEQNGDKYRVVDIITEGSSMTKNYYDQFHRMLTTKDQGYPYMVQKLKDKVAKKEAGQ